MHALLLLLLLPPPPLLLLPLMLPWPPTHLSAHHHEGPTGAGAGGHQLSAVESHKECSREGGGKALTRCQLVGGRAERDQQYEPAPMVKVL
jgi:hypothetical protein